MQNEEHQSNVSQVPLLEKEIMQGEPIPITSTRQSSIGFPTCSKPTSNKQNNTILYCYCKLEHWKSAFLLVQRQYMTRTPMSSLQLLIKTQRSFQGIKYF